jgi:hypothetical protein
VIVTKLLTVTGSGRLDVTDEDLLIDYSSGPSPLGSWTGTGYTGISSLIMSGANRGGWDGNGLVTSLSEIPSDDTVRTLGAANAGDVLGISGAETALWNGQTVDVTAVLVKYTYAGDANLDGKIDPDDFANIDYYDNNPAAFGYFNGDFNYDGDINVDDHALIEYNENAQGDPL